jgi:hypothetical protein
MAQDRDRQQGQLVKEQLWRERVDAWLGSGLTQLEFCRLHGISQTTLSRWKVKLAMRDRARASKAVAEVSPLGSPEALGWTELRIPSAKTSQAEAWPAASGFEIVLPQGWSVRMGPQFEAEPLRRLLSVLEERSC